MAHNLFVTSTDDDSGKSILSLGIMEMLIPQVERVGYFRPIIHNKGRTLESHFELINHHYKLGFKNREMYAVTYDEAEKLISLGEFDELIEIIIERYKEMEERCDFVLIEGSDFADESATLEMDFNTKIAKELGTPVLIVTPAHEHDMHPILQTMKLASNAYIDKGCEVIASIMTRVPMIKREEYKRALLEQTEFEDQFVSVFPESRILGTPSIQEVQTHLHATLLFGDKMLHKQASKFVVGGMHLGNYLWGLSDGAMIVATGDRVDLILGILAASNSNNFPSISGIILTGEYVMDNMLIHLIEGMPTKLPILIVRDTLQNTILRLEELQSRILPSDSFKIATALNIFNTNTDTTELAKKIVEIKSSKVTPKMFEYGLVQRVKKDKKHIVLPEGEDDRILKAAQILSTRELVEITLLGNPLTILQKLEHLGMEHLNIHIVDPATSEKLDSYAEKFYEMRKKKGITMEVARDTLKSENYFGTMMVFMGDADGMVSGAVNSTADTIRPAFQIIKTKPDCPIISSVFLMCLEERVVVYGDCAVNPNPNAEELASIAVTSAETGKTFGIEPKIALLSYSTGDSGKGDDVDKVRVAAELAKEMRPEFKIEGPIQYDAAVSKQVASTKMPNSDVAGQASVFIFPDLNTGNNTYKAVQRETGAIAIGPILQGLNKPVNDLSRGCSVVDIINTVIITAIQAQSNK